MAVLHLFGHPAAEFDGQAVIAAVNTAQGRGVQVVSVSMLGHKADVAFMAVASDMRELRSFQTAVQTAGVFITDSYVSITEVSEYAANVPEEMKNARLYPQLPPAGKKTASAGFDDFEWGVTLFAVNPDDLKDVVYTMRFDEASAVYAEFGAFYVGMVTPVEELVATL